MACLTGGFQVAGLCEIAQSLTCSVICLICTEGYWWRSLHRVVGTGWLRNVSGSWNLGAGTGDTGLCGVATFVAKCWISRFMKAFSALRPCNALNISGNCRMQLRCSSFSICISSQVDC